VGGSEDFPARESRCLRSSGVKTGGTGRGEGGDRAISLVLPGFLIRTRSARNPPTPPTGTMPAIRPPRNCPSAESGAERVSEPGAVPRGVGSSPLFSADLFFAAGAPLRSRARDSVAPALAPGTRRIADLALADHGRSRSPATSTPTSWGEPAQAGAGDGALCRSPSSALLAYPNQLPWPRSARWPRSQDRSSACRPRARSRSRRYR